MISKRSIYHKMNLFDLVSAPNQTLNPDVLAIRKWLKHAKRNGLQSAHFGVVNSVPRIATNTLKPEAAKEIVNLLCSPAVPDHTLG